MQYLISILIQNHKSTILDVPYVSNLERARPGSIDENLAPPRQLVMIRNSVHYNVHIIPRVVSQSSAVIKQHVYSVGY